MGSLISKKNKSTIQKLEEIDEEIKEIIKTCDFNDLKFKTYFYKSLFYFSVFLIFGVVVLYLGNFTSQTKIFLATFLISIPLFLWAFRNLMKLYFKNFKSSADIKIKKLLNEKNNILENIKETETYKNAMDILKKFDEHSINNPIAPQKSQAEDVKLQSSSNGNIPSIASYHKTPRPIFPKTLANKTSNSSSSSSFCAGIINFIVSDGSPSYRYALICSNCHSHNGMALKEEFEYLAYKCAYCEHFNPARKHKPIAPPLEQSLTTTSHKNSKNFQNHHLAIQSSGMDTSIVTPTKAKFS